MKNLKRVFRVLHIVFLLLLALSGAFLAIAPRRPDQDYDNEIKTEIAEGKESNIEMSNRN